MLNLHAVPITAPNGEEHLVTEAVFAHGSYSGSWTARCGKHVVSASLTVAPGRLCPLCDGERALRR